MPKTKMEPVVSTNGTGEDILELIERIDLSDAQYWDFYTVMSRGMKKRFASAHSAALKSILNQNPDLDLQNPDQVSAVVRQHLDEINLESSTEDMWLLHGTVGLHVRAVTGEWVDKLTPVLLDQLPDKVCDTVLARMRVFYKENEEAENFTETHLDSIEVTEAQPTS